MQFAVRFGPNGARIIKGYIKADKNTVINPSLEHVRGIPPHQWKLVGGSVVPSMGVIHKAPQIVARARVWVLPTVLAVTIHFILHFLGV